MSYTKPTDKWTMHIGLAGEIEHPNIVVVGGVYYYRSEDEKKQQEPRKVTLYQYLYRDEIGTHLTVWTSVDWSPAKYNYCNVELLKTFTREIEY